MGGVGGRHRRALRPRRHRNGRWRNDGAAPTGTAIPSYRPALWGLDALAAAAGVRYRGRCETVPAAAEPP
jgi:hypothetical protein